MTASKQAERYHYGTHRPAQFPRTCSWCADESAGIYRGRIATRTHVPWWRRLVAWLERW